MKIKGLLTAALFLPFFVTLSYAGEQTTTPSAPPAETASAPETSAQTEAPALPPKLTHIDADQDRKISRDELVAFITKKAKERIAEKARRLDTDGDNCLSKEELTGKNKLKVRFDDVDTDKDGKISKTEAVTFVQKKAGERATKLFHKMDKNGDGFITGDDLKHPQKEEEKVEETQQEEDM